MDLLAGCSATAVGFRGEIRAVRQRSSGQKTIRGGDVTAPQAELPGELVRCRAGLVWTPLAGGLVLGEGRFRLYQWLAADGSIRRALRWAVDPLGEFERGALRTRC